MVGRWLQDPVALNMFIGKSKKKHSMKKWEFIVPVLLKCWMKGLNHQVDEHNIEPNYTLSWLIKFNDFVTTEDWAEYFDYLCQFLERGSPDLPGWVRKRLALNCIIASCNIASRVDEKSWRRLFLFLLSFLFYRIGKSEFCWFGSIGHHSR